MKVLIIQVRTGGFRYRFEKRKVSGRDGNFRMWYGGRLVHPFLMRTLRLPEHVRVKVGDTIMTYVDVIVRDDDVRRKKHESVVHLLDGRRVRKKCCVSSEKLFVVENRRYACELTDTGTLEEDVFIYRERPKALFTRFEMVKKGEITVTIFTIERRERTWLYRILDPSTGDFVWVKEDQLSKR